MLKQIDDFENQWIKLIETITDKTTKTTEETKYDEKKFGTSTETGLLEIQQDASNWLIKILSNKETIRTKRNTIFPQTVAPPAVAPIQLPDLPFITFDATFENWPFFWDQFSPIHNHTQLTCAQKLQYLKKYMSENVDQRIKMLPNTDKNYTEAVDFLKNKYGKKENMLKSLFKNFIDLPASQNDLKSCRNTYENVEQLLFQLHAAGENLDTPHILMEYRAKFPAWILKAVELKLPSNSKFEDFRQEMENQITINEKYTVPSSERQQRAINTVTAAPQQSQYRPRFTHQQQQPNFRPQQISQQSNYRPQPNYQQRPAQQQSYRPQQSLSTPFTSTFTNHVSTPSELTPCVFCDGPHAPWKCRSDIPAFTKWKIIREKKGCFHCLKPFTQGHTCDQRQCRFCQKFHNVTLCSKNPKNPSFQQQPSFPQQQPQFQQQQPPRRQYPSQQYPAQQQQRYYNSPQAQNFSQQKPQQNKNINAVNVFQQPEEEINVSSVTITPQIPQEECDVFEEQDYPTTIFAKNESSTTVILPVKTINIATKQM
uniref:Gag protein n=1 Tax=Panagrolaimus davidi TaxID=227884 RepID=A0A914P5Z4_9BILA